MISCKWNTANDLLIYSVNYKIVWIWIDDIQGTVLRQHKLVPTYPYENMSQMQHHYHPNKNHPYNTENGSFGMEGIQPVKQNAEASQCFP